MRAWPEGHLLAYMGLVMCCMGLLGSAAAAAVTLQKPVAAELHMVTGAFHEQ